MRNNEELKRSHASGFGGSDANMLAKIGMNGIDSLSTTNKKRVLVALGKMEASEFAGNVYTEAGHLFEDHVDAMLDENQPPFVGISREVLLQRDYYGVAMRFKTFAHADFADELGCVFECKFINGKKTDEVADEYRWQLQWYYMLGANSVNLIHGTGNVLPFECHNIEVLHIDRDEEAIEVLQRGVLLLNDAIVQGVFDDYDATEVTVSDMDEETAAACRALGIVIARIKETEALADKHKATLLSWMEANGVLNIKGDGFTVSYVSPTTRKTFDTKKAQAEFPELKNDKYYKSAAVKSSVKIILKQ